MYKNATIHYEKQGLQHYNEPSYLILQHWPIVKKVSRLAHKHVLVASGKSIRKALHKTLDGISMIVAKSRQEAAINLLRSKTLENM